MDINIIFIENINNIYELLLISPIVIRKESRTTNRKCDTDRDGGFLTKTSMCVLPDP